MNVTIKIIPHAEQRYPTCGDWFYDGDNLEIRVSKMSDWRYELLVVVHELVEVVLCEHAGVTQQVVDQFDMDYEKNRPPGDNSEPGDDPKAPYRYEHCIASGIERVLAAVLGVTWRDYEMEIDNL